MIDPPTLGSQHGGDPTIALPPKPVAEAVCRHMVNGSPEQLSNAESCLKQALYHWQLLSDPEPELSEQNFRLDGKEYHYLAAKTHGVLTDLDRGMLTRKTKKVSGTFMGVWARCLTTRAILLDSVT